MAASRKSNWSVWLGVTAIFVFGVITGVLGAAFYVHHLVGHAHSRGPQAFEEVALQILDWELDLDPAQEAEVARILRDVHIGLMEFKMQHAEEIDALLRDGLARVEATLHDGQRADWEAMRARIEAAHRVAPPGGAGNSGGSEHPH